jgi:hypothetical protein
MFWPSGAVMTISRVPMLTRGAGAASRRATGAGTAAGLQDGREERGDGAGSMLRAASARRAPGSPVDGAAGGVTPIAEGVTPVMGGVGPVAGGGAPIAAGTVPVATSAARGERSPVPREPSSPLSS